MTQRSAFRWYNRSLPSLLGGAIFFLYMQAVFKLLDNRNAAAPIRAGAVVCFFLSALGIANERRWGYSLALASNALWFALYLEVALRFGFRFNSTDAIEMIITAGVLAMLLWPESREHQAVYFTP